MFVVDTNVLIVANGGKKTHANTDCQISCVNMLRSLVSEIVVIDAGGCILDEYGKYCERGGSLGAGDVFFIHLFNSQGDSNHIKKVKIHKSDDDEIGFTELPKNKLDPSDRKFLAVAVKSKAVIVNATDSDWDEQKSLMKNLGVEVCQLCPKYAKKRPKC